MFPTTAVQRRQHVEAVGCRMFASGLTSTFVFGVLQIPSGCIEICSGSLHPTAPPDYRPASYLTENSTSHLRRPNNYSYVEKSYSRCLFWKMTRKLKYVLWIKFKNVWILKRVAGTGTTTTTIIIIIIITFRKSISNIPGNHEVKELQKTAILGTAHILRKVLT